MEISGPDQELLESVAKVLEQNQFSQTLGEEELSDPLLQRLLESNVADLADIGLYILSLRETNVGSERFAKNDTSTDNVARFMFSLGTEKEKSQIGKSTILSQKLGAFNAFMAQAAAVPQRATPVQDMTIILHGTFAAGQRWWRKGSQFWNYIDSKLGTGVLYAGTHPFFWSGANNHTARVQAALDLQTWVNRNPTTNLDIIAHSHGGNVCLLASRLGVKIRKLMILGTPIRLEYLPELGNINQLFNVFSTADNLQTPAGTIPNRRAEGRTLGDSEKIANYRADNDGSGGNPGHSDLHEPATWKSSRIDALL